LARLGARSNSKTAIKDRAPREKAPAALKGTANGRTATGLALVKHSQRCDGLATFWLVVGAVLPVVAVSDFCDDPAPREWLRPDSIKLESALQSPPVPPPRLVLG
jgi:hypothetical protein